MSTAHSDPSDPQVTLLRNLEDGIKRFGDAGKEYATAVRAVSGSLEHLAVSIRQLSLGNIPPDLHARVDRFGTSVGKHQNNSATLQKRDSAAKNEGNESASKRSSIMSQGQPGYTLTSYINDFSKDVGSATEDLKTLVKVARKKQEQCESATKKYNEARLEVEKIAKNDVKKNVNSADNPKYVKKMAKRDELRKEAERCARELDSACEVLLKRRVEIVTRVMDAMGSQTFRYWTGVAQMVNNSSRSIVCSTEPQQKDLMQK